jgi:hypothetical protein
LARRFRRRDVDHDLITLLNSRSITGHVAWRDVGPRRKPTPPTDREMKEMEMDPQLIEWGPAHLRDEATVLDVEPQEPPEDN